VRDSLSALDQAIACCGSVLKLADVRTLLGMFGSESLKAVADAVRDQNGERMLEIVQELEHNGHNLQHFCRELARYWRNLLVAKIAGKPTRLISASDREQQSLIAVAREFSEEDLTRYLQLTLDLFKTLQSSLQPRFHLELGLVKLVQVGKLQLIEEALAELNTRSTPAAPLRASAPAPRSEIARLVPPSVKSTAPAPETAPSPRGSDRPAGDLKTDLVSALLDGGMKMSADAVEHSLVKLEGAELLFTTAKRFMLGLRDNAVAKAASTVLGRAVKVRVEIDAEMSAAAIPANDAGAAESAATGGSQTSERALNHPAVKRFQELFPGAHIRSVRNLNE